MGFLKGPSTTPIIMAIRTFYNCKKGVFLWNIGSQSRQNLGTQAIEHTHQGAWLTKMGLECLKCQWRKFQKRLGIHTKQEVFMDGPKLTSTPQR